MIKIYIFADSYKHFSGSIQEYTKRLKKWVEIIKLRPVKKWTPDQIITSETRILLEKLSQIKWFRIILSPWGKNLSTKDFVSLIEEKKNRAQDISFFIGGANGLDYEQLEIHTDFELSLGQMTLPHWLALTMLLEQIYRYQEIIKGSGYHK